LLDEVAASDDHEVIGHLGHLGQDVARHEDGAALLGEVHEEVADPADPLGVESVGGLVEQDGVRVAEQQTAASPSRWRIPRE
jgi:hypothetical protein